MIGERAKTVKELFMLPRLEEKYVTDKSPWESIALKVSPKGSVERQPIMMRDYFLKVEPKEIITRANKTPTVRSHKFKPIVSEKRLNQLDSDLDKAEIAYKISNSFNIQTLESLFISYLSYLESLALSLSSISPAHKSCLTRAKQGFESIFNKTLPKLKQLSSLQSSQSSQTLMTINPSKTSAILSKLGDIINDELSNTDKLEKFIQKKFLKRKKSKINNSATQTDYKLNENGVIEYEFKSYEDLQNEITFLRHQNAILIQEKTILNEDSKELPDVDRLILRNKILEQLVIEMRNGAREFIPEETPDENFDI